MQVQFNQWQSINLQDFSNSFKDIVDSVKDTDSTLTSLSSQYIYIYDGTSSSAYGSWGGSYDISLAGRNFLGSSPVATSVKLTNDSPFTPGIDEKYQLTGSISASKINAYTILVNGGSFSSLTHFDSDVKDYSIKGSFTYSLGSINGSTVTSAEINQSNGKLTFTGTLNLDNDEAITGGTITSLTYTNGTNSFAITNTSVDVSEFQALLNSAADFSTISSFFLSSTLLGGNDSITGDSADNTLDGGAGVDKLIGGTGNDTYIVDLVRTGTAPANYKVALQDTITEAANAGTDTVQLRLQDGAIQMNNATTLTLAANLDNLDASLTEDTKLNLTGNALANTLTGNDADNILDGGAGVDSLIGGLGDDTYILDLKVSGTGASANVSIFDDSIEETNGSNNGSDTIKLRGAATLATATTLTLDGDWIDIENLDASATGKTKLNLTGNSLNNTLTGNAAANILTGGDGNDTYVVNNIDDSVVEEENEGTDLIQASITYTLGDNVENLELLGTSAINGTGNDEANIITGNAGNNILDGKGGIDTLRGGKGNDTYIVDDEDDVVIEAADGGTDLVKASVDYELTDFVENLTLTGSDDINGTGNALANTITGNAANNILDGGAGVDKLIGGNGDDIYIVDLVRTGTAPANYKVALQDTITEAANAGTDAVQLRLQDGAIQMNNATTLTLGANLERLDASDTGLTKLNLTGNALANILTGNDANNILDGGAGVDTLRGGEGDDTYILDLKVTAGVLSIEDTVVELNSTTDGIDTIKLRGSVTLTEATTLSLDGSTAITWSHVENIDASATKSTKLNLTGNEFDNTLTGNAGANIIDGGMGDDTLDGGAGNDTLIGGVGSDTLKGGLGADIFKWSASDMVVPGDVSGNTDTITDFSIAQKDKLDLRDLLIDNTHIENYIDIVFESGSTHIRISSTGEFANGTYDDAKEDAHIVLSNLNLFTATKTAADNDAQLIGYLTQNNYLLID